MRWVALGGFLFGLGFWDKITFFWILLALAAGVLATARNLLKVKPIAVGALSFLAYNYKPAVTPSKEELYLKMAPSDARL